MDNEYLKMVITVLTAAVGWLSVHYFNTRRDRSIKRKEIVTAHLINAYRILTHEITRRNLTKEKGEKLESVISDIQLFGSSDQVKLAKKLTEDIISSDEFLMDDLINNLKHDLRSQLGLEHIEGNVKWLRLNDNYKVTGNKDIKPAIKGADGD